jgi:hypothetical protein
MAASLLSRASSFQGGLADNGLRRLRRIVPLESNGRRLHRKKTKDYHALWIKLFDTDLAS